MPNGQQLSYKVSLKVKKQKEKEILMEKNSTTNE